MKYKDKLQQANMNIEELIEMYIEEIESKNSNYCPSIGMECTNNCEVCKEQYYNKLYEELKEDYIIK